MSQAGWLTLIAGVVFAIDLGRPSPSRDEVATLASSRVSITGIAHDSRLLDAVHATYYVLVHLAGNGTDDVLAGRWISVACLAATVGLLSLLGARLRTRRVGLLAGLFLLVSPLASLYAQESRPFALATMAATASGLALVLAADAPRTWVGLLVYGLTVVATGLANVLALSVVAAHLAYLLVAHRRLLVPWSVAAAGAVAVLGPFLRLASRQSGQIGELGRPGAGELLRFFVTAIGSTGASSPW